MPGTSESKPQKRKAKDTVEREVQVHLAEYEALRREIDHYSERIDRMSGIYLTALFAISGYLLVPDSKFDLSTYHLAVRSSEILTALYVFMIVLNSVLLIRIGSFFTGILAIAQYINYVVRPRLVSLIGENVMAWDGDHNLKAKKIWMPLRSIGQGLFVVLAEAISAAILLITSYSLEMSFFIKMLYIVSCIFFCISLGSVIAVGRAGASFHRP